jgi:Domain of unknown function (DUF4442)
MNNNFALFQKIITNPIKYNLFMLTKLPMGFFSGLKIVKLTNQKAGVSVRFKWINQNPFKSIYFAVLSMAAELSTGILAFGYIYNSKPNVSMLVSRVEADFVKKATGKILFTCNNGNEIAKAIETTLATGEGITIPCTSTGINEQGEVVAQFIFTWSFKRK